MRSICYCLAAQSRDFCTCPHFMNQANHDRVAGTAARTRISRVARSRIPEFGGLGALLGRFRDLTPMEDRGRPGEATPGSNPLAPARVLVCLPAGPAVLRRSSP